MGGAKDHCAIVTLNIKNTFNSAECGHIRDRLERMDAPTYILNIILSYFSNRRLLYKSDNGKQYHDVTAGVPQGSVFEPFEHCHRNYCKTRWRRQQIAR